MRRQLPRGHPYFGMTTNQLPSQEAPVPTPRPRPKLASPWPPFVLKCHGRSTTTHTGDGDSKIDGCVDPLGLSVSLVPSLAQHVPRPVAGSRQQAGPTW